MTLETAAPVVTDGDVTVHVVSGGGVSVVVAERAEGLPEVVHWGADLGPVGPDAARAARRGVSPSGLDRPWETTLLPTESDGWGGRPAFAAQRFAAQGFDAQGFAAAQDRLAGPDRGATLVPRWRRVSVLTAPGRLVVSAEADGIHLRAEISIDGAGVVRVEHEVTNDASSALELSALEAVLPVGDTAAEMLDFSGRWTRERAPQRAALLAGSRVRESRRGRTGHDSPLLSMVGTAGFDDSTGEVWGVHLAWSADAVYRVDALADADPLIGAGALLRPGEIVLAPGESFRAPVAVFVWSDTGIDGVSRRLHRSLRARAHHPRTPRPVTLNTWEAVYFHHRAPELMRLADVAAQIGVERFVLDDGWFAGRRGDHAGLGDWRVDEGVWPDGLHPLVDHVHAHGMEFGLWVEPEMVNLDSDLARRHPEWLLQPAEIGARAWRNQYVLDLTRPEVWTYLRDAVSALVTEYGISYLKWDQNRDVIEGTGADGSRSRVHAHTLALYDLLDDLRQRHPDLEIESCASGGARVDLGILERTDRVWASDTNDPIERLAIQRWTETLLPPELIGAHVGPEVAHTTGRATSLGFRIAVAMFGSMGIEWDISSCSSEELAELAAGIAAYRRLRPLLHTGDVRHLATGDAGLEATAVTAPSGDQALVRAARTVTGERALPPRLRVPGLTADAMYRVRPLPEIPLPRTADIRLPQWLEDGQCHLTGAALAGAGVRLPMLRPGQALVIEVDRVE